MKIFTEKINDYTTKSNWEYFLMEKHLPYKNKVIGVHWFEPSPTSDRKYYYTKVETRLEPGEQVVIELETLKTCSIRLINDILYSNKVSKRNNGHHKVVILYNGNKYILDNLEEWKHSFQDPNDVNRMKTFKHPILQDYEDKNKINKEKHIQDVATDLYSRYKSYIKIVPEEQDMNIMLDKYGKLYHIYNSSDPVEKLRNYIQVKFYIDNKLEPDYIPDEDVELSIGNATMLDDYIYKFKIQTED